MAISLQMPDKHLSAVAAAMLDFKHHFIVALLGLIVLSYAYDRYRPGLQSIPGPPLAKWSKLWRLYDVYKGQSHQTAIRLHQKHGPLVRMAPNVVSVGDPQAIKIIYGLTGAFPKVRSFQTYSYGANTNLLA